MEPGVYQLARLSTSTRILLPLSHQLQSHQPELLHLFGCGYCSGFLSFCFVCLAQVLGSQLTLTLV